jgi:magnesium transporter
MISLFRWDNAARQADWPDPDSLRGQTRPSDESPVIWWIDLEEPTEEEEHFVLMQFLPVHPLTLEDATRPRRMGGAHLPKVEEFDDYLFVVVNPLRQGVAANGNGATPEKGPLTSQLSVILTHNVLITHHCGKLTGIDELKTYLRRHPTDADRGPDFLFHIILDATVDAHAPVLDGIVETLDGLETQIHRRPTPELQKKLLRVKRTVNRLRKSLVLEREVLARLQRGEFRLIDRREMAYYRNVYDHLVRYAELIDSAREMVSDLMQTYLAAISNRLNEVMKVLTMISTIVLPMTLVAGVYGMNFEHMPELKWQNGYPFALGLMAMTAAVAVGFFRWKRWL